MAWNSIGGYSEMQGCASRATWVSGDISHLYAASRDRGRGDRGRNRCASDCRSRVCDLRVRVPSAPDAPLPVGTCASESLTFNGPGAVGFRWNTSFVHRGVSRRAYESNGALLLVSIA